MGRPQPLPPPPTHPVTDHLIALGKQTRQSLRASPASSTALPGRRTTSMPPQRGPGIYALVEAEAILACQTVGLDPGLGIVHADARGRQSLALDVMVPSGPRSTPSCSPSWSSTSSARSTSWIRPMAMFAFAHRSRTSWPRPCRSGPSRSARSQNTSPTSSARRWTAGTRLPPRSRNAAIAMRRRS